MFRSAFGDLSSRTHLLLMDFNVLLFSDSFKHNDSLEKGKKNKIQPPGEDLSERFHYRLSQHENVKRLLLKSPAWECEI